VSAYYTIKIFKLKIFGEETDTESTEQDSEAQAFISALGGKDNIVDTDACITRLRMSVKDSIMLTDTDFTALGAKGVIRPNTTSIQIVLGTKAEGIAEAIKEALKH